MTSVNNVKPFTYESFDIKYYQDSVRCPLYIIMFEESNEEFIDYQASGIIGKLVGSKIINLTDEEIQRLSLTPNFEPYFKKMYRSKDLSQREILQFLKVDWVEQIQKDNLKNQKNKITFTPVKKDKNFSIPKNEIKFTPVKINAKRRFQYQPIVKEEAKPVVQEKVEPKFSIIQYISLILYLIVMIHCIIMLIEKLF